MKSRAAGFSLMELMVTLVLSGLLMVGLITMFNNIQETYRLDFAIAQIQDKGRFAYRYVEWDVQTAGYQGCFDTSKVTANVVGNSAPTNDITADAIQGYEVGTTNWTPAVDPAIAGLDGIAKVGSDVLTIHKIADITEPVSVAMSGTASTIGIADNDFGFGTNDLIMITDCVTADLFQASDVDDSGTPVVISHAVAANSSANLTKPYATDAVIALYEANTYYVAPAGEDNPAGNPVFSLFRQDVNGNQTEVVEGVNSMQVMYGEQISATRLRYVDAATAGLDFSRVRSIRLGLLIQSFNQALTEDDDRIYTLPGDTVSPSGTTGATQTYEIDRTLKQVFSTTVTLRNRL